MESKNRPSGNKSGIVLILILAVLAVGGYVWRQAQPDMKLLTALGEGDVQAAQTLLEAADWDITRAIIVEE